MTPTPKRTAAKKKLSQPQQARRTGETHLPSYLQDFGKKCVTRFDVFWVCEQISRTDEVPAWFRSLLTRMLVGWVICPQEPQYRKFLAWHHINNQFSVAAQKSEQHEPSYLNRVAQAMRSGQRYDRVYVRLGGMNSKRHHSLLAIRDTSQKYARHAKLCLQAMDVILYNAKIAKVDSRHLTLNSAKATLRYFKDVYMGKISETHSNYSKLNSKSVFNSASEYDLEPVAEKTFEDHWHFCQPSAEFWAALYCIPINSSALSKRQRESLGSRQHINALDAIIFRAIYALPFHSSDFQKQLVERAKYFETVLTFRKKLKFKNRFPGNIIEMPSTLSIFSEAALASQEDSAPGTKGNRKS